MSNAALSKQDQQKRAAAEAAMQYVEDDIYVGVGTGSTVNHFIDCLADRRFDIKGAVSSSDASTARLKALGIDVVDLNYAGMLPVYIDGADEANQHLHLIKGGGGALTREKIIAGASAKFICIVDDSKVVDVLGKFPLPVEVIPMARSFVAREIVKRGGQPEYREGFVTDNGNVILDVHGLNIVNPTELEMDLNNVPGVVTVGLFAKRPADVLLVASDQGVKTIKR